MIVSGGPLPGGVPETDLARFVLDRAAGRGELPALIDGSTGRTLSYGDLARASSALASSLKARGCGAGETLAVALHGLPEFAVVFYGALAAGLRVAAVDPATAPEALDEQLRACQARLIVMNPGHGRSAARTPARAWEEVMVLVQDAEACSLAELIAPAAAGREPEPPAGPGEAAVLFTAGTTGPARGVRLSHGNLAVASQQLQARVGIRDREVILAGGPSYDALCISAALNAGLREGATLVGAEGADVEAFADLTSRHRVTRAHLLPPAVGALVDHRELPVRHLHSLELIVCGGGPLAGELQQACEHRLGIQVIQAYGLTELAGAALVQRTGPVWPGRVGPPLPGTACRLVDLDTGAEPGHGRPGELWVRGPQVMLGYLDGRAGGRTELDGHGWLHTGDLASVNRDGSFRILGRAQEQIEHLGVRLVAADLESILLGHPAVADCAVLGVSAGRAGAAPVAVVVPGAEDFDAAGVMDYVNERLVGPGRITQIELVEKIPRSAAGEVMRHRLDGHGARTVAD